MPRTVVLRHDLPDGTHHFDWLIEPIGSEAPVGPDSSGDPDERVLIAWRLPVSPIPAVGTPTTAERLAPHRRLYLDYEGPIGGDRGVVRRVASGEAGVVLDAADRFEARARFAERWILAVAEPSPAPRTGGAGDAGRAWSMLLTWV